MIKLNFFTRLSLQVILIFAIIILGSFLPDTLPEFFGDWTCKGSGKEIFKMDGYTAQHTGCTIGAWHSEPELHWGYKHYMYMLMGICLFIVQCFRIGNLINNRNKE